MKLAGLITSTAVLLGLSHAAPSKTSALVGAGLIDTKSSLIAPFSEKFCNDLTDTICRNDGGYWIRYSVYDPVTGNCVCSIKPSDYMVAKQCPDTTCPSAFERAYYWPSTGKCFCEAEDFLSRAWNIAEEKDDRPKTSFSPASHVAPVKAKYGSFINYIKAAKAALTTSDPEHRYEQLRDLNEKTRVRRQGPTDAASAPTSVDTAVPTFVPPPKTDITPALINQSLAVQPQNTATISSVKILISAGIVTFYFQLDGPVADTLAINSSTSLVCGAIGLDPGNEPDISVVPKFVQSGYGTPQTVLAGCLLVAINMLSPNVINYYVINQEGKLSSLVGSNKILGINMLDQSQPLALSMVPIAAGSQRRGAPSNTDAVPLKRRQILAVNCGQPCPFAFMDPLQASEGHCGCVFKDAEEANMQKRGVSAPDVYTATMSKEACQAMTCHDTGKPAVFMEFDMRCWCVDQPLIEGNPSGWTPST